MIYERLFSQSSFRDGFMTLVGVPIREIVALLIAQFLALTGSS